MTDAHEPKPVDPPFDVEALTPFERELWYENCASPDNPNDGIAIRVRAFIEICTLEASGPPEVAVEWLRRSDPNDLIGEYHRNVLRAMRAEREG